MSLKYNNYKFRISLFLILLSLTVILFAQGTPNNIFVRTDSNNNLMAFGTAQVGTLSQPTLFSNTLLRTDSSGNLGVFISSLNAGNNGQSFSSVQSLTELTTISTNASTDTTIQMPANSLILAVPVRVTVIIPTAATFTVGDSGSAARFSTTTVAVAADTTDTGNKAGVYYNASALSVRITPNASPLAATGRVRITIYYYTVTPPTS